jgi:hypothetical protein
MHIISNEEKSAFADGIVHDLDYRSTIFASLELRYTFDTRLLTISKYNRALVEHDLYITKYRDPQSLIAKIKIENFEQDNKFKINYSGEISVWA